VLSGEAWSTTELSLNVLEFCDAERARLGRGTDRGETDVISCMRCDHNDRSNTRPASNDTPTGLFLFVCLNGRLAMSLLNHRDVLECYQSRRSSLSLRECLSGSYRSAPSSCI